MRIVLFLALILLPVIARAEDDRSGCLSDQRVDNRISGKLVYVKTSHPTSHAVIQGYKIVLLKPQCFDYHWQGDGRLPDPITQVQLEVPVDASPALQNRFFKAADRAARWKEMDSYLRPRVGTLVTVTGELRALNSPYYIAAPQVLVGSITPCEVAPKTKGVVKC